jgi:hypothetical protein
MGTTNGLGPAPVDIWVHGVVERPQIQYDEASNSMCAEGFMAPFEYRGDASIFIASGRGASLLPNAVRAKASPRYLNLDIKLYICFGGLVHVSSNIFSMTLIGAPRVPTLNLDIKPNYRGQLLNNHCLKRYVSL